jgi:pimeloyl-ACP methyl ester carboxylesterase
VTVRRSFVDGRFGQVHLRTTVPVAGAQPLVCLHATAYSSQSFLPLMAALHGRRQVIAPDAPGYGDSDAAPAAPSIGAYAAALVRALELAGEPVALLGYHTGAYIAAELAIARPDLVERLVLIGIPYFQALDLEAWRAKLATRHRLEDRLDQFDERWRYFITHRDASVTLPRGFANFVDELKAWPHGWWAHEAMFAYDSDARLPLVPSPTLVLNPAGHLAPASRAAAELIPDCVVVERPHWKGPVLENAARGIADEVEMWLAPVERPLTAAI